MRKKPTMSDQMSGLFQLDEDTLNAGSFACDVINTALHWGVLKPDTRLQAIADAWEKGPELGTMDLDMFSEWPALARLLDALTEEKRNWCYEHNQKVRKGKRGCEYGLTWERNVPESVVARCNLTEENNDDS